MKHCVVSKAAAASAVAALLLCSLSGCSLFRPIDGAGREDVVTTVDSGRSTDSAVTTSTSAPPPDTTVPVTDPPETKPVQKRVSVAATGDNIIHDSVYVDAKNRASDGAKYDFLPMYSGIAEEIAGADAAFINQETPMAGESYGISGFPTFNSPREAGQALVDVGFDVINLANNHILDKRAAGARATVEYVQSLPVTEIGVYLDKEDYENIRVTEINGIRIAWVAFSFGSNNPYDPATSTVIMPLLDNDAEITARVKAADAAADFVIVSAHWGDEDVAAVSADQRRLAKVIADAGADVIIGHHPHVLQAVEWCTTASGRKTLVAYSLGNLLSSQLYANNMIGGMLTFDIVMDENGKCTLEAPVMNITVNHYSGKQDASDPYGVCRYGMQLYMLEDYTEAMAAEHGCRFFSADFSLDWIYKHVRSVIDEEFLPAYFE